MSDRLYRLLLLTLPAAVATDPRVIEVYLGTDAAAVRIVASGARG